MPHVELKYSQDILLDCDKIFANIDKQSMKLTQPQALVSVEPLKQVSICIPILHESIHTKESASGQCIYASTAR